MKITVSVETSENVKPMVVVFDTYAKLTAWAAVRARDADNARVMPEYTRRDWCRDLDNPHPGR